MPHTMISGGSSASLASSSHGHPSTSSSSASYSVPVAPPLTPPLRFATIAPHVYLSSATALAELIQSDVAESSQAQSEGGSLSGGAYDPAIVGHCASWEEWRNWETEQDTRGKAKVKRSQGQQGPGTARYSTSRRRKEASGHGAQDVVSSSGASEEESGAEAYDILHMRSSSTIRPSSSSGASAAGNGSNHGALSSTTPKKASRLATPSRSRGGVASSNGTSNLAQSSNRSQSRRRPRQMMPRLHSPFLSTLSLRSILLISPERVPLPLLRWAQSNGVKIKHFGLTGEESKEGAMEFTGNGNLAGSGTNIHGSNTPLQPWQPFADGSSAPSSSSIQRGRDGGAAQATSSSPSSYNDPKTLQSGWRWKLERREQMMERSVKEGLEWIMDRRNLPILVCDTSATSDALVLVACLRKLQGRNFAGICEEYRTFAGPRARNTNERFIEMFDPDLVDLPSSRRRLPDWYVELLDDDEAEMREMDRL